MSDTHGEFPRALPPGDVLVHAGDLTSSGSVSEATRALLWLSGQPHPHKVVVAGNHDRCFAERRTLMVDACRRSGVTYLENESAEVAGLQMWGSPLTPQFGDWAFMRERGAQIRRYWEEIPEKLDVLVTHGPPANVLDVAASGERAGCQDLADVVRRRAPRLHVFGHIHEAAGAVRVGETLYVNAATRVVEVRVDWYWAEVLATHAQRDCRGPRAEVDPKPGRMKR